MALSGAASRNAATGGSAQPKKVKVRVKEKERRMVPLARRRRAAGGGGQREEEGRRRTGAGAGLLQLHSLVSYLLLLQRETKQAPPTPVAASTANRRYIGRPDVCRR